MTMPGSALVDAYIARQPAASRPLLHAVRRIIRRTLPDAEETISYRIPTYKQGGHYVVYFAGWKHHWSLYPLSEPVRRALGRSLESYRISKGTVRFPFADPVPTRLVERIVLEMARAAAARRRTNRPAAPRRPAAKRGRRARA